MLRENNVNYFFLFKIYFIHKVIKNKIIKFYPYNNPYYFLII